MSALLTQQRAAQLRSEVTKPKVLNLNLEVVNLHYPVAGFGIIVHKDTPQFARMVCKLGCELGNAPLVLLLHEHPPATETKESGSFKLRVVSAHGSLDCGP